MRLYSMLMVVTVCLTSAIRAAGPSAASAIAAQTEDGSASQCAEVPEGLAVRDRNAADRLAYLYAERDRVQREIEQLRETLPSGEVFSVDVEMVEIDLTRMSKLGFAFETSGNDLTTGEQAKGMVQILNALQKNGISKTLMAPRLMVSNGRKGSMFVGSKLPIPSKPQSDSAVNYVEAGQRVDVLVEALGNDKVLLHLDATLSTVRSGAENKQSAPSLEVAEISAPMEMPLGETWILRGGRTTRTVAKRSTEGQLSEEKVRIETLILVTVDKAPGKLAALKPTAR